VSSSQSLVIVPGGCSKVPTHQLCATIPRPLEAVFRPRYREPPPGVWRDRGSRFRRTGCVRTAIGPSLSVCTRELLVHSDFLFSLFSPTASSSPRSSSTESRRHRSTSRPTAATVPDDDRASGGYYSHGASVPSRHLGVQSPTGRAREVFSTSRSFLPQPIRRPNRQPRLPR